MSEDKGWYKIGLCKNPPASVVGWKSERRREEMENDADI